MEDYTRYIIYVAAIALGLTFIFTLTNCIYTDKVDSDNFQESKTTIIGLFYANLAFVILTLGAITVVYIKYAPEIDDLTTRAGNLAIGNDSYLGQAASMIMGKPRRLISEI